MRKISKLLLSGVLVLLSANLVKAESCETIELYSRSNFVTDAIKMRYGNSTDGRMLTFKDASGRDLPAYCHNVAKPTGAKYEGSTFMCSKAIFDSTTSLVPSDLTKAYEAGIVKILVNGYNVSNKGTGVVGYTAADLAIKTYELLWPSSINTNNSNNGTNTNYLKAYQYFANKMLDDSEVSNKIKEIVGSNRSKYPNAISYTWLSNGDQIENRARELILIGLNEAIRFKQNGAASITWNTNPVVENGAVTETNGIKNYSSSIAYTFKLDKFTSAGALANVKFTCQNCNANGIDYILYVNDKEMGANITNTIDLLGNVTNGTGNVTIKVQFTGNSNQYNCEELDYKFDINYKDDTISNEVYEMQSTDPSCAGGLCQPIYTLYNTNVIKNAIIEDSYSLCKITCEELKRNCESSGSSSKACQEYRKQYPNGCINCGVGIKNNECANPGETSNLDLIEGYEIDPTTCTQSNSANITGCIIDNKDAAGNSYVDDTLGNGLCTVSCKEDFHFKMPGNKDVPSGRYFRLETDVEATKTCYLKMNGNPSAILSNFATRAQETVDLYKELLRVRKIKEALNDPNFVNKYCTSARDEHVTCETEQTTRSCNQSEKNDAVKRACPLDNFKDSNGNLNKIAYNACKRNATTNCVVRAAKPITKEVPVYSCTIDYTEDVCGEKIKPETFDIPNNKEYVCSSDYSESNNIKSAIPELITQNESDIVAQLNDLTNCPKISTVNYGGVAGADKVYVSSEKYTVSAGGSSGCIYNGLGALNACVFWEMSYNFNPDLYFNYEDEYMKDVLTDKLDLVGDITKGSTTHYYCARNDGDSAYEQCSTGWKNSPIFTSQNVCVCDGEKCEKTPVAVNSTMRMKESITYEASYITPTQFYSIYPTGAIVAAKSFDDDSASELTNALPVGLGMPQGVHHYALYAKNLGEYFGTGKYGRVWGSKNSVVSTTLKSAEKCIANGALKYDANLNGTYIDNGVWVCDYNVNANKCTKTINEDGKVTYRDKNGNITDAFTYDRECVCPDCPVTCDPNGCTIACSNDKCPVICPTCLYSNGKNFVFRSISLSNLNPNDRDLGANWRYDDKQISTALEMKAKLTTDEIITDGETIYDDSANKYVMKMTMDSAMINKIKARKDKNYTSNTLECYDYTQDGKTYKNIFCYSKLTDELLSDSKTKDKIKFSVNRPFSEAERKNSQNSEYWTTWTKKLESSKWNVNTVREISYFKQYDQEIGIGPSWK